MIDNTQENEITIHFSLTSAPSSPRITETISKNLKASELRAIAANSTHIPLASIKLIFRGRIIQNDEKGITDYSVEDGCVVHCLGKPVSPSDSSGSYATSGIVTGSYTGATTTTVSTPSVPSSSLTATLPVAADTTVEVALQNLKSQNTAAVYSTALSTLSKVISNILSNASEEKYRKLKQSNASFGRRLGNIPGGPNAMLAVGFTSENPDGTNEPHFVLKANADAWNHLLQSKSKVEKELDQLKRNQFIPPTSPSFPSSSFSAMPPIGGIGSGAGDNMPSMTSSMQQQMSNFMSDPAALQNMMQNPMVRQMIQNDPRVANNQMLRQALDDPNTMNRISQMMSDPNMRQMMNNPAMMQSLMNQMPTMGGMGGDMPQAQQTQPLQPAQQPDPAAFARMMQGLTQIQNATTAGNYSQQQPEQASRNTTSTNSEGMANNSYEDSSAMTEEQMIAEAIARSLRES